MVDFFKMLTGKTMDELIGQEVQELARRGQVTWAEMDRPMNGYERDHLLPALTDDAFLRMFVHCAKNVAWCGRSAGTATYDYAVPMKYAPEAVRRGIGVPLDQTPSFAAFGVSLPVARIRALEHALRLVVRASPRVAAVVEGEVRAALEVVELGALATELFGGE